jgi:hypothetical protein
MRKMIVKRGLLKILLLLCAIPMTGPAFADPSDLCSLVPMVQSGLQTGTSAGSGWVYVVENKPGERITVILTNSHVIEKSEKFAVVFLYPDDTENRYTDVKVLFDDPINDVALLWLQGINPFERGLKISLIPLPAGTIVQTAGFPGGAWSFQPNAAITNARIRLTVHSSNRVLDYIQLFSGIDHGSSGGPALIRQENSGLDEFAVIGINTLASQYQKQSYAIPPVRFIPVLIQGLQKLIPDWEHENNDAIDRAEVFPGTVTGCFFSGDSAGARSAADIARKDVDWYKIHLRAGEFHIQAHSPEAIAVSLYDARGNVLDSNSGVNPSVKAEVDGDVFIMLRAAQDQYFQTYSISSLFVEQDPYESDSKENPIWPDIGQELRRSLYSGGDEDWFAVQSPHTSLLIECNAPFELMDGDRIVVQGSGSPAPVQFASEANTRYLFRVFSDMPREYHFRVSFVQQEREPNNILEEAMPLEAGLLFRGSVDGNDTDWYTIPARTGTGVLITVEGSVLFDLYDNRGRLISSANNNSTDEGESIETTIDEVYIRVRPVSVYREDYTLIYTDNL